MILDSYEDILSPCFDKEKQLDNSLWQEMLILLIPKTPLTTGEDSSESPLPLVVRAVMRQPRVMF